MESGWMDPPASPPSAPAAHTTAVRWAVAGLLFALPLVLAPFGFQRFTPSKEFVLAAGGIGIAFLFLISYLEAGDSPGALSLRRTPLDLPVATFLLVAAISVAVAHNRGAAIVRLIVLLGGAGVFWVLSQDAEPARTRRAVGTAVVAAATIVAVYAIGEVLGFLPSYRGRQYGLVATLGNPNHVAEFLALSFSAGLAMFLRVRKAKGRSLLLVALVVQYAAILVSGSKGAWGAWVAGVTVAILTLLFMEPRKLLQGLSVPSLAILIIIESTTLGRYVASVQLIPKGEAGMARIIPGRLEAPPGEWLSFQIRAGMARDTLNLIREHPVLGVGIGNYFSAVQPYIRMPEQVLPPGNVLDHAHNDYLEILAELGPLGLMAFLWILALAFRRAWRLARAKAWPVEDAAAALFFMAAFSANSLINFGFYEPVPGLLFWTTLGLLAASPEGEASGTSSVFTLRPTRWAIRLLGLALAAVYAGIFIVALRPVMADASVRRAATAYARSDLWVAEQSLARALAINPDSFVARFIRLKVLEQQGRLAEAAELARQGLLRFPGSYVLQGVLADVLASRGDLGAARVAYEEALRFYPYLSASVVGLGWVAEREGDLDTAARHYDEALKLNPKQALAWGRIGLLRLKQGKVPEAVRALRTARDLMPENSEIALRLGQAYLGSGDRLRGLMELDRARRMDPMNLEILQVWRAAMAGAAGTLPPGHLPNSPSGRAP